MSSGRAIDSFFSKLSKRKPSSTSSNSDSSPVTERQRRQEKKQRVESDCLSEEEDMAMQSVLEDIREKIDGLATKEDIKQLRSEVKKMIDSLTIKVDTLESRVFDMEKENDSLKGELRQIKNNNSDLQKRLEQHEKESKLLYKSQNDHEQYIRRWNCRMYKVPEEEGETVKKCVEKCVRVFTEKVGVSISENDIEIAHRTGPPPSISQGSRPRSIIVRFFSRQKRDLVLRNRKNLKNKGISVGEDLTKTNFNMLREAQKHSASLAAWSSNGKILTKLKNGKVVHLDISMNVSETLQKAMN